MIEDLIVAGINGISIFNPINNPNNIPLIWVNPILFMGFRYYFVVFLSDRKSNPVVTTSDCQSQRPYDLGEPMSGWGPLEGS